MSLIFGRHIKSAVLLCLGIALNGCTTLGPDYQRLFNVGRLGWPRKEGTEMARIKLSVALQSLVSLMHVVHNFALRYHHDQMLAQEENGLML